MMHVRRKYVSALFCIPLIGFMLLGTSACSTKNASAQTNLDLQSLAQEFADDLSEEYLFYRENAEWLRDLGLVVYTRDVSYNIERLEDFELLARSGKDGSVTIVFKTTDLVFSRIGYKNGQGYYLRYQYDKSTSGEMPVTAQLFTAFELHADRDADKAELVLYKDKASIARFTLTHVKWEEE